MKATDFIKTQGLDKAREVVEGAPDLAEYYSTIDGEYYRIELHTVNLRHLKRLVESIDMVKEYGGVNEARDFISSYTEEQLEKPVYSPMLRLKKAIADVEACQAPTLEDLGDDTNLENRISPLCKVQVQ